MIDFKRKKAIIVLHEATTGPGHDLRDFLLNHGIEELLFIAHPLFFVKESRKKSSRLEFYKKGKLIKTKTAFHWVLPEPLLYIKDYFYTFYWSFTIKGKIDYFFGLGNLNAFSGHILKFFGRINKVIYYVIDFIPQRFNNKFLNWIYENLEKFCALYSNSTWNLSPVMVDMRNKKWNIDFPNQLVVLHGVHFFRIKRVSFDKVNKNEIIYMGGLLKKQGIQLVIEALPIIYKKIPNVKFTIIGSGEYENELKKLSHKLSVSKLIDFLGYIPSHKDVENRMAKAAIAIAMYEEKKGNYTYFTDPGKVKNYLGAGVPVAITDVPYIARAIEKERCGIIVKYNKEEFAKKIVEFLSSEKLMKTYRRNAFKFAKRYDWDKVFINAFDNKSTR
ncbi:MAG: glycosyltransferase [Patescibacteria group bacterium]|nr:glycosyltransferase [Patescibacteria group bacterium]